MNREEWLAARKLGVSGSDIAVLMGANPYKTENALLMDKLGIIGAKGVFNGNLTTRVGNRLEPMVAELWAREKQVILMNGEFTHDPEEYRFFGTPDFLTVPCGLEIKTAGEHIHSKGCPSYQEFQCRWYMMISRRPEWVLRACLVPKDREEVPVHEPDEYLFDWVSQRPHREYLFERDLHLEREMRERAHSFLARLDALAEGRGSAQDQIRASFGFEGGSGLGSFGQTRL